MSRVTFLDSSFNGKYSKFFTGLYNRNKRLLRLSIIIFLVSLVIGIFTGYFFSDFTGYLLTKFVQLLHGMIAEKTTLSIFLHNFRSTIVTYIGGIVGIIPAGELFINGFSYGSFVGYFMHGGILNNYRISNPVDFVIYTLPHGIFEIPAFIIAGAAGFRLTSTIIHILTSLSRNKPVNENYWEFKDSLILLAVAVILLVIAAIIEANLSLPLGNCITGLNLH